MMILRARDNNIQSFAYIWLHKGNQNKFHKHSKLKGLDGGLEPNLWIVGPLLFSGHWIAIFQSIGLPVHIIISGT